MAAALAWRQTRDRVRFQPILDDGRGLYRIRTSAQMIYRPVWRRRLSLVDVTAEAEPITFRSRSRALRIAVATEELALARRASIEAVE